jgi:hypothetical protein
VSVFSFVFPWFENNLFQSTRKRTESSTQAGSERLRIHQPPVADEGPDDKDTAVPAARQTTSSGIAKKEVLAKRTWTTRMSRKGQRRLHLGRATDFSAWLKKLESPRPGES